MSIYPTPQHAKEVAPTENGREHSLRSRIRSFVPIALIPVLAVFGLGALATSASAHANIVSGVASCASPAGTGYKITWTVANDYNLNETVQVASATGGVATVSPSSFPISASGNGSGGNGTTPYKTATLIQTLLASATGTITISVNGTFSDNYKTSNSGSATLPTNCSPQTPPTTPTTLPKPPTTTTPPTTPVPPVTTVITPPTDNPMPGMSLIKTERDGSSTVYTRGPILAVVGEKIHYQMVVSNTGGTSLTVSLRDAHCDPLTLAPVGVQVIAEGSSLTYTCSRVVVTDLKGHIFRNVAVATAMSPQGTPVGPASSTVLARILAPKLKVSRLTPAKSATPVLKNASFTG